MTFAENFQWSQRFLPAVRGIVGPFLLHQASWTQDVKEASDLVVFECGAHRIAVRVRSYGWADRAPHEFTVRSRSQYGSKTELHKIEEGMGDWLFYGHAHQAKTEFVRWMIVNLASFRAHLIRQHQHRIVPREFQNLDGSRFHVYDVRTFTGTPRILVAASHPHEYHGLTQMAA